MRRRGFTLLEVLVAVSILGLGLTVILSSQMGLFTSAQRAENLTLAVNLARCRMSETEMELLKNGYPLIDQSDEGNCCEEEERGNFSCSWKIERVELPEGSALNSVDGGAELSLDGLGDLGAVGGEQGPAGALLGDGGLGSLSGSGAGMPSMGDIAPMVMSMVYPNLKSMLEASIRKVTVTVLWREGVNQREYSITQYVTNPQQGGIDEQAGGLGEAMEQLEGLTPPAGAGK